MEHVTIKFSEEELQQLKGILEWSKMTKDTGNNDVEEKLLTKVESGLRGIERIKASRL